MERKISMIGSCQDCGLAVVAAAPAGRRLSLRSCRGAQSEAQPPRTLLRSHLPPRPTRTNDVKAPFLRPRCHDSYDTRVPLFRDQQRVDVQKLLCADKDKIKLKSISDRAAIDVRPGPTWRSQDSASLLISQGWHQGQTIDNCRQDKTRPAAFLRV